MSARRRRFDLAPEARLDLSDILLTSEQRWGKRQWAIYKAALRRGFQTVRDHPHVGVARDELEPGPRAFQVEHHVLYYRLTDDAIEVARILHERMDATRHLGPRRP